MIMGSIGAYVSLATVDAPSMKPQGPVIEMLQTPCMNEPSLYCLYL